MGIIGRRNSLLYADPRLIYERKYINKILLMLYPRVFERELIKKNELISEVSYYILVTYK